MGRENVKEGATNKVKYRGEEYYISLFQAEIFLSSVMEVQDPLTAAGTEALASMTSMSLNAYCKDDVVERLGAVSRSKFDLPGILKSLLEEDPSNDNPMVGKRCYECHHMDRFYNSSGDQLFLCTVEPYEEENQDGFVAWTDVKNADASMCVAFSKKRKKK